jgi:hypothetical protein
MAFDRFWSNNEPVPDLPADNFQPTVAILSGALHLVWSSNRILYHSVRLDKRWSSPVRIVAGEQPSMVASPDGRLHCLFANPFVGNWEIYHITYWNEKWSLPKPVSRTSGISAHPSIAADADGLIHAVWDDTTPGESVVYYGRLGVSEIWNGAPIPNGRGCLPTLVSVAGGDLCVAWQDRTAQNQVFDVYSTTLHEGHWSLPDIVSDSLNAHSLKPSITANARGNVHLVWLEEEASIFEVWHSDKQANVWSRPVKVSTGFEDCRQARIVANPQGYLQVIWIEGNGLHHRVRPPDYNTTWWVPQTAQGEYRELSDLGAVVAPSGELHVVWSGYGDGESRMLYYAQRSPIFAQVEHR